MMIQRHFGIEFEGQTVEDGDCFFVMNSDVTCEFPLQDMLRQHRASVAVGTIAVRRITFVLC